MALRLVGIVDFNGQAHCLDHASTVSSYLSEIYSVDPVRTCWCGENVGGERPRRITNAAYIKMNDGIKGRRSTANGSIYRKGSRS